MNGVIKGILSGVAIGAIVYSTGYNKGYKHAQQEELKHMAILNAVMERVEKEKKIQVDKQKQNEDTMEEIFKQQREQVKENK